jgi:hypothetical protein
MNAGQGSVACVCEAAELPRWESRGDVIGTRHVLEKDEVRKGVSYMRRVNFFTLVYIDNS